LAGALAWVTQPLRRGVAVDRIAAVLPGLRPADLEAARRAAWASALRSRALEAAFLAPAGRPVYPRMVAGNLPSGIRAPMVLVSFHVGALCAVGAALEDLPGDVVVLHDSEFHPRHGVTLLHTGTDEWSRAAAFRRALAALRSGGFVFLTVDYAPGATVPATMLGRRVSLARGAFALTRMSGAPLVPLVAGWRGGGIKLHWGEPITAADEEALAAATAAWLERHLLAFPGDLAPVFLDLLEGAPSRSGRPPALRASGRDAPFRSP
jgi:hypothetical protein